MTESVKRGRLITFEGGEGAGKSTQILHLRDRLGAAGVDVVTTREPGGTAFAEQVRDFILSPTTQPHVPLAEALLFTAARADHVAAVIRPALTSGSWVLCDRFTDSTRAYQGAAGGVDRDKLRVLEAIVLETMEPDLTVLLDLPPTVGLERAGRRARSLPDARDEADRDPYEARDLTFHERLRAGFLEIAKAEPDRCAVIDAQQPEGAIAEEVWHLVSSRFGPGGA